MVFRNRSPILLDYFYYDLGRYELMMVRWFWNGLPPSLFSPSDGIGVVMFFPLGSLVCCCELDAFARGP